MGFLFFMLYVGLEVAYGGYLYTFVVQNCVLHFTPANGAFITSVYWGMFAFGRFVAIPLSVRFSPTILTVLDFVGVFVAATIILVGSHNPGAMWFASGLLGISMASVFPSGMNLIEEWIDVTGRYVVPGASLSLL